MPLTSVGRSAAGRRARATAEIVRDTYRQNQDRLVEVKNRYDPRNLFRLNANIVPTA